MLFRVCVVHFVSFPLVGLSYHGARINFNVILRRRASVGEIYNGKGAVFEWRWGIMLGIGATVRGWTDVERELLPQSGLGEMMVCGLVSVAAVMSLVFIKYAKGRGHRLAQGMVQAMSGRPRSLESLLVVVTNGLRNLQ